MRKSLYDSWAIKVVQYVFTLFLISFYFLVLNLPLIVIFILLAANKEASIGVVFTYLALLPVGPAFCAVLSMVINIVNKQDFDNVTKKFFKYYKQNFMQAIGVWSVSTLLLYSLYIDIKYTNYTMKPLFYIIATYVFIVCSYAFIYIAKFYLEFKNIVKLAYMSTFKYSITSLTMICTFISIMFLAYNHVYIGILFFASAYAFGLVYFCKKPLQEVEKIIVSEG